MILLDILNLNLNDFTDNNYITVKFINNYNNINSDVSNTSEFFLNITDNEIVTKEIKIISFLGEGSYGKVYKIKCNSKYYALKINTNELPNKLLERYNSLIINEKLKKYIITIFVAGKIQMNDEYAYYSIMEYGGDSLRNSINSINCDQLKLIFKQLFNVVYIAHKYKFLLTDLKLGNITLNTNNRLKIIDIYMYCEEYTPCFKCKIVRTYSTIEIEKEKRIYEDADYNYTCTFIPFAVCIIDLICKNTLSEYTNKICNKFNINLNTKQIIPLIQIACYNFINKTNDSIKIYKNLYKHKKYLENEYHIIKEPHFYEYFMTLIQPKHEFEDFISKKKLMLIINDLINLDPNQRSLKFLKEKLIS